MSGKKFFRLIGAIFVIAAIAYYFTTPSTKMIPLTGIIDGNEVIVSSQITDRIVNLTVDEGSAVKKGDLIAQLDPKELAANVAAAKANVTSLEHQVIEANHNLVWTSDQTGASSLEAEAVVTSTKAQLDQAKVAMQRDQDDLARMQMLFAKGEVSAQDRDHAEAAAKMSQANVKSLEDTVKAETAAVAVAEANRKQVDVRKSAISSTEAQLQQARAAESEAAVQLGYTQVYSPIDGVVSVRVAKQGEVVQAGSPIIVVVDMNDLWVRADVEETYIDQIQLGQQMAVVLPSGDKLEGKVIFKGVEGDFATQRDVSRTKRDIKTFAIKVAVPNPQMRLFTGMTATVELPPLPKKSWLARL
jgi:HlyD family secretion protein